jgi:YesN/AraC family two-component response regulator
MFEKCIDKAVESKNWELLTTAFFNLANQNYELELTKYHDILFSKEIPDATPDLTYVRLQYQGIRHMQQKEYAQARQCFEQQLQHITTRWAPERDSLASLISIATTYRKEQKIAQSIDYLTRALQLTVDQDISDVSASICLQLSEQYRTLGNGAESDRYHQRYMELMEQTHVSQLSHIAELNYINALKKEEAHTQVLEQRQFMQQMALLAGLIMLVIAIAFSLLLWRKNRELRERNKSLYEKNRQVIKMEADAQQLRKVYSKSSLNDEQRESLVLRIQEVLDDADIICQQDFTLGKLAKLINSNTTYVSQVINEKYGMTFSTLLGSLRIKVACQWMDDPARSGNITIEAIATGTGFKSRTAFVNTFKRETGLKPSEFLRMAKSTEVSS